jgi:ribosome recycling factor
LRVFSKKGDKGGSQKAQKAVKQKEQVYNEFEGKDVDDVAKEEAGKLQTHFDTLKSQLAAIKSGKASSSMLDNIQVNAYGDKFPLKELAQIIIRGENSIAVQLYDTALVDVTAKAISTSSEDLQCSIETKVINVKLSTSKKDMTEKITVEANKFLNLFKSKLLDQRREGLESLDKMKLIVTQESYKAAKDTFEKAIEKFKKSGDEEVTKKIAEFKQKDKL